MGEKRGKLSIGRSGAVFKKIRFFVPAGMIVALSIGLASINMAATDIWADEACTLATVENGLAGITYATAVDVHPPLYYYLIKFFYCLMGVNDAEALRRIFFGRLFSLLPLIIVFLICIAIGITKRNERWALLYPFMVCQYFPVISCSCEIRMYSWAMLFVIIAGTVILYIEKRRGEDQEYSGGRAAWGILAGATLCVCYTHYFVVLPVMAMWIVMGVAHITDRYFMKKFLMAGAGVVIGYIPWGITFIQQFNRVHGQYWIPETDKNRIIMINRYLLSTDSRVRLLFYVMFLLLIVYSVRNWRHSGHYVIFGLLWVCMPWILILMSLGISEIYRPILEGRYLIPALGIAGMGELLLLKGMFREKGLFTKTAVLCICVMAITLSGWNLRQCFQIEKSYEASWSDMIDTISEKNGNVFLYIQGGAPMVRPLTVMFPEAKHICENANMTEYNQFLFDTIDYEQQDYINPPYFIIVAADNNMRVNDYTEYLGNYNTCNGEYAVYYQAGR